MKCWLHVVAIALLPMVGPLPDARVSDPVMPASGLDAVVSVGVYGSITHAVDAVPVPAVVRNGPVPPSMAGAKVNSLVVVLIAVTRWP